MRLIHRKTQHLCHVALVRICTSFASCKVQAHFHSLSQSQPFTKKRLNSGHQAWMLCWHALVSGFHLSSLLSHRCSLSLRPRRCSSLRPLTTVCHTPVTLLYYTIPVNTSLSYMSHVTWSYSHFSYFSWIYYFLSFEIFLVGVSIPWKKNVNMIITLLCWIFPVISNSKKIFVWFLYKSFFFFS